jgi:hypothetical protein
MDWQPVPPEALDRRPELRRHPFDEQHDTGRSGPGGKPGLSLDQRSPGERQNGAKRPGLPRFVIGGDQRGQCQAPVPFADASDP